MSEEAPNPPGFKHWRLAAALGAGAVTAGVLGWSLGPGAPALVSSLAEGRQVWRLGALHVEGLSGGLANMHARRLTLSDEHGVWAEARDVRVNWAPLALVFARVDIEKIDVAEIEILRSPKLAAPRPEGAVHLDADIASMRARSIEVAEAVTGRAAALELDGFLEMKDGEVDRLALNVASLGEETDRLSLRFNVARGELARVALRGEAGGLFAHFLDSGESAVRLDASADGDGRRGSALIDATIGDAAFARGAANWTPEKTEGTLTLTPSASEAFADITSRIGPQLTVSGSADGAGNDKAFRFAATADNLNVRMQGRLNRDWRVRGPVQGRVATGDIRRLFPWLELLQRGGVAVSGAWTFGDKGDWKLVGQGEAQQVGIAGARVSGAGPLTIDWSARKVDVAPNLALTVDADDITEGLTRNARLAGRVSYDRQTEVLHVRAGSLDGEALRLDVAGSVGNQTGELKGEWRVMRLAAASGAIGGTANGAWRVVHEADQPWRLSVGGDAAGFTARTPLVAQMFGRTPQASLESDFVEEGMRINRVTVEGAQLRAGATGIWADALDMRWEASVRGPLRVGAAALVGAADATGTLTGARERPRIAARAHLQRFDLAGAQFERPTLDISYDFAAGAGEASAQGSFWGGAAQAHAILRDRDEMLALDEFTASTLGADARGMVGFADAGPMMDVRFAAPLSHFGRDASGTINGTARMTPVAADQAPRLDVEAETSQAQIGEMRIAHATYSLTGPVGALAMRGEMRGATGTSQMTLSLTGGLASEDDLTVATVEAQGRINGAALATRAPARFAFTPDGLDANASVTSGGGAADFMWRGDRRRFTASARFDRAALAPLAAVIGRRAEGTLSGNVELASAGEGLTGAAQLSIDDARLPARMRSPLDVRVDGQLQPTRITGSLTARSTDGLDARIEGSAPVETRALPVRIALAAGGEGRADWRANGPADALFGLVGGLDQNLSGTVSGDGSIRFTSTTITGAGDLSLANGRFEDKRSGVVLREVNARMEFVESGASRFTVAARDEGDGRLTGEGAARGMADGRMDLKLRGLRIIDNEDVEATATGDIAFEWAREGPKLSGALRLDRAQLTLATRAESVMPVIDVVEVNRPLDEAPRERPRAAGPVAALDLTLTAPGRVFTRGRGLEAEWSLDARLRGTSAVPLLYGEARLVRGEFNLAGQRFDLSRGTIRLAGAVENSIIDLLAERVSPDLTARIAVAGDLMDPDITLSSEPALPEDEILPQILFGRNAEELSPLEGAQLAASLGALTGAAAFDIAGMARAAIGLDRLDVREDGDGLLVTGGRYLTRDVYLELSRSGLGEPGTRVEWRVRPRLSLVTSFTSDGDQRASVRWRKDY
ncbi:MAG: translocation/assembly module TamB domain-containing protein [Hyphomonadaceae bacterium]|nr:translocation/assembly module TamB domain-containing protein [Hyphomonadaceae bacterium]